MQLATVLTPLSEKNLRLAAQCGVEGIVHRYPGTDLEHLRAIQRNIESYGLRLAAIEGYLPLENIKRGCDDGTELNALKLLIRQMGEVGIPLLCYNFMVGTDWVRTRLDAPERGGAWVTAFDHAAIQQAQLLHHQPDSTSKSFPADESLTPEHLWQRLERLLQELIPVAEQAGVTLAMHPDDPPVPTLLGRPRIMHCVESFERLVELVPSPRNGICFCQGTFAAMGVDIPATIRRLGKQIRYVHFRDVRGSATSFAETFHDNGPTDMVAAMQAYRDAGFSGPLRPDHVPQLIGDEHCEPGYSMQGRLFAYGYIRGLMQATEKIPCQ